MNNLPSCDTKKLSENQLQSISFDDELGERQNLSICIYQIGSKLDLPFDSIYTAVIYMHRFLMIHPIQSIQRQFLVGSCLFLSSKVTEVPRTASDLIREIHRLNNSTDYFKDISSNIDNEQNSTNQIFNVYQQNLFYYENLLLSSLGFSLDVEQPYRIIKNFSKNCSIGKEIIDRAINIVTKSVFLTLFTMKYTNNLLACFSIYLSLKLSNLNIDDNPDGTQWFHLFNEEFTEQRLKEIVDEYRLIFAKKMTLKFEQRFDKIHQNFRLTNHFQNNQEKIPNPSTHSTIVDSNKVEATKFVQNSIYLKRDSFDPQKKNKINSSGINSSSCFAQEGLESKFHSQDNSSMKIQSNITLKSNSSAKPIPTLLTSSNSNQFGNFYGFAHHSRIVQPTFVYSSSNDLNQHYFDQRFSSMSTINNGNPSIYPRNFIGNGQISSDVDFQNHFIPYQFSDCSTSNKKIFFQPDEPPIKRIKYNVNLNKHY